MVVEAVLEFKGVQRTFTYDEKSEDGLLFMWTEGNYSCDCNRSLFFARAAKEEEIDIPCGEGGFRLVALRADGRSIL